MIPGSFYVIFLIFAGILLLVLAYGLFTAPMPKDSRKSGQRRQGIAGEKGVCPICGTLLTDGAQIKSALFPGEADRMCHIFGCPHCHPYKEDSVSRTCPVCKKALPQEGYLIARLFQRPQRKRHVHILGCTNCRFSKKK